MRIKIFMFFCVLGLAAVFAGLVHGYPLTAALNSVQVVPQNGSTGRGSCKIDSHWGDWGAHFDVNCTFSGLSGGLIDADVRFARVGQNGGGSCLGRIVTVTLPNTGTGSVSIVCPTEVWWPSFTTKDFYVALQTANFPDGEIRGQIKPIALDSDVNGEGRAEISVFRPSDRVSWAYCDMSNGPIIKNLIDWQPQTDSAPFLADFDGDAIADQSFIRTNAATGVMYILFRSSRHGYMGGLSFGNTNFGDVHAFGDYGGIGRLGIAVYRPSNGRWFVMDDLEHLHYYTEDWGILGGTPCAGDFDGDGKTDLCVARPDNGQYVWNIRRSSDGQLYSTVWGLATDTIYSRNPVDVDVDGASDILVSRDENGKRVFYALRSSDGSMFVLQWGLSSDTVKLGDYDSDGITDFAAIRNEEGKLVWYITQSSNGQTRVFQWGLPGDL